MIEAPHYSSAGAKRDANFALPADYFDGTVNEPVLHQAVKVYLNNQRQGTHMTKSRSFVSGGNQKPWKQKGTGRARQGSIRSPQWRGGGVVFGPTPRDYRTDIPRKVRQLARKSALNARAREGALHVVERLAFRTPKTAQLAGLLGSLGLDGRKALVLTAGHNANAYLSGRNLPSVEVMAYPEASAYDILWSEAVVVEEGALTGVMPEPLAEETEAEKAERAEKTARSGKTGRAVKAAPKKTPKAKPAAKAKAAKKTTAKKSAEKPAKKKPAPKKKGSK
ncbi:MAG: large subunit ribosomal protein [Gemmatimonadales bacterium]|jgi:large subunit ribosomal protein L4|nr:large subunit ribosomal protein [Gemmatimonadales bacterium]